MSAAGPTGVVRRRLTGLGIALLVFGLDRLIKLFVEKKLHLPHRQVIELVPFFDLRWAQNYGVSFSLLSATSLEMRWLLVLLTLAISAGVLFWLLRETAMAEIGALGLVLGGALGNIHDRAYKGFVVDYADLHFGQFRPFQIFNLADAAISIGVVIILARSFLSREKHEHQTGGQSAQAPTES